MLISSKEDIFMRKMFETCMKLNATKFRSKDLSVFYGGKMYHVTL